MSYHFYAMLSRMKNIYRWGLMRNTKQENLSEHSLEVAFVAHALAIINNRRLGGNINAAHGGCHQGHEHIEHGFCQGVHGFSRHNGVSFLIISLFDII